MKISDIKYDLDQLDKDLMLIISQLEDGLVTAAVKKLREITDSE